MRRVIRRFLRNTAVAFAIAASALVGLAPMAAQAATSGVTTGNVNMRTGPGTSFQVITTLSPGTSLRVNECQPSWCFVSVNGTTGWVSSSFISTASVAPPPPSANPGSTLIGPVTPSGPNFGVSIGPGGVSVGIGNPPAPPVIAPPTPSREVCFFSRNNFRGSSFCLRPGQSQPNLIFARTEVNSIDNPGGRRVTVCTGVSFVSCSIFMGSAPGISGTVGSVRVD